MDDSISLLELAALLAGIYVGFIFPVRTIKKWAHVPLLMMPVTITLFLLAYFAEHVFPQAGTLFFLFAAGVAISWIVLWIYIYKDAKTEGAPRTKVAQEIYEMSQRSSLKCFPKHKK